MLRELICPVCKSRLEFIRDGASLACTGARRHCFDISSDGYVNLDLNHSNSGDSKEAVRARRAFLREGY